MDPFSVNSPFRNSSSPNSGEHRSSSLIHHPGTSAGPPTLFLRVSVRLRTSLHLLLLEARDRHLPLLSPATNIECIGVFEDTSRKRKKKKEVLSDKEDCKVIAAEWQEFNPPVWHGMFGVRKVCREKLAHVRSCRCFWHGCELSRMRERTHSNCIESSLAEGLHLPGALLHPLLSVLQRGNSHHDLVCLHLYYGYKLFFSAHICLPES